MCMNSPSIPFQRSQRNRPYPIPIPDSAECVSLHLQLRTSPVSIAAKLVIRISPLCFKPFAFKSFDSSSPLCLHVTPSLPPPDLPRKRDTLTSISHTYFPVCSEPVSPSPASLFAFGTPGRLSFLLLASVPPNGPPLTFFVRWKFYRHLACLIRLATSISRNYCLVYFSFFGGNDSVARS